MARQLGYSPNLAARALAKGRTNLYAVLTFDFQNPYSVEITTQLHEIARAEGAAVISCMVDGDLGAVSAHVDGVVALDYSPKMPEPLHMGAYLALGIFAPEHTDACLIKFEPAALEAMSLLLRQGRRKIIYVTGEDPLHDDDPRKAAYLTAMRKACLEPEILEVPFGNRTSAHQGLARRLVTSRPDAVFCRNDSLALGCLRALHEAGIQVPTETAIVGSDGTVDSLYTHPSLTTLAVPFSSICQGAWKLIQARLEHPEEPTQRLTFEAAFQPRGTT